MERSSSNICSVVNNQMFTVNFITDCMFYTASNLFLLLHWVHTSYFVNKRARKSSRYCRKCKTSYGKWCFIELYHFILINNENLYHNTNTFFLLCTLCLQYQILSNNFLCGKNIKKITLHRILQVCVYGVGFYRNIGFCKKFINCITL